MLPATETGAAMGKRPGSPGDEGLRVPGSAASLREVTRAPRCLECDFSGALTRRDPLP